MKTTLRMFSNHTLLLYQVYWGKVLNVKKKEVLLAFLL